MTPKPAKGEKVALPPKDGHLSLPLWRLWRSLVAEFTVWRFVQFTFGLRRRPWQSVDGVMPLRQSAQTIAAQVVLAEVSDSDLGALRQVAETNARRQGAFLQTLLLAYFTIPIGAAAIWAQIDPAGIPQSLRAYPSFWGGAFAGLTTALVMRFVIDWRARNLVDTLSIIAAERSMAERAP